MNGRAMCVLAGLLGTLYTALRRVKWLLIPVFVIGALALTYHMRNSAPLIGAAVVVVVVHFLRMFVAEFLAYCRSTDSSTRG